MIALLANTRMALRALAVNKMRSLLTMLGIIIGVGAVIVMIAVGAGARARVAEQIRSIGANLLILLPGTTTSGGARLGFGSAPTLFDEDAAMIRRDVPGVAVVAPLIRGGGQIVVGNTNWSTVVYGVTADYLPARDWEVIAGRPFTSEESDNGAKVVLIGQTVAASLFGSEDPVDQIIRVNRVPLQVIGVLDRKGQSMQGIDQDDTVLVPMATARNRVLGTSIARRRAVGAIWVKGEDGGDLKETEKLVRELVRQRHRLQPNQDDDFSMRNLTEVQDAEAASSRVLATLLAAVASVSLVVGGIGIMNIMLVSVTERTREIGLRMAVGARGRDILAQFLTEAVLLSLIGGVIGIAIGVGTSFAVGHFAGWRIELYPESIVLAVGFSAAVGIFFGFYPARKAARLQPIEALRYE